MFVCMCIYFLALSTEEDLEIISSSYEDIGVFADKSNQDCFIKKHFIC